jgi:hypothetical protein
MGGVSLSVDLVRSLGAQLDRAQPTLDKWDRYYDCEQPTSFIGNDVRALLGPSFAEVVAGFPALVIDRREHRLDVEGFRLAGSEEANEDLWDDWQANDLDEESGQVHLDAMLYGVSFAIVWADDAGAPLVTAETPHQVTVSRDPATRQVRAALKRWADEGQQFATLYLPDRIEKYRGPRRSDGLLLPAAVTAASAWELFETLPNPLGVVLVVPFTHRRRTKRPDGQSVLHRIAPLVDVINKLATDLVVTSDFHSAPFRYINGLGLDASNKERLRAEVEQYLEMVKRGRFAILGGGAEVGQLEASSLDNFVKALGMFVGWMAAMAALPLSAVGISTDNAASADALRALEANLVKESERTQRGFSGSWEQVMRLSAAVRFGVPVAALGDEYRGMETIWRDPATPTVAQKWDAAVKGVQAQIMTIPTAQEFVGMSPAQRARDAEYRRAASATAATADVEARRELARRLRDEDGLTLNASLAASGLLQAAALNSAESAPA